MPARPSTSKGKGKDGLVTMTEEDREAAEKQKRSFERSLAGPSVGKAGR